MDTYVHEYLARLETSSYGFITTLKKLQIKIKNSNKAEGNITSFKSQLLELYLKHMKICHPMHATEISILTSWSNTCYALIIAYRHALTSLVCYSIMGLDCMTNTMKRS